MAAAMALFMFSMAGIPPTAGFFAKFYVFSAAVSEGYIWLVVIAVMNSLVSVYYYFRIPVKMYMQAAEKDLEDAPRCPAMISALVLTSVGVLWVGIFPNTYLNLAAQALAETVLTPSGVRMPSFRRIANYRRLKPSFYPLTETTCLDRPTLFGTDLNSSCLKKEVENILTKLVVSYI